MDKEYESKNKNKNKNKNLLPSGSSFSPLPNHSTSLLHFSLIFLPLFGDRRGGATDPRPQLEYLLVCESRQICDGDTHICDTHTLGIRSAVANLFQLKHSVLRGKLSFDQVS